MSLNLCVNKYGILLSKATLPFLMQTKVLGTYVNSVVL